MATMRTYGDGCGIAHALDLVGERWALLVVRELLLGPKRFTDLRDGLPNVSPNVLAQRLRELEQAAVVQRRKLPLRTGHILVGGRRVGGGATLDRDVTGPLQPLAQQPGVASHTSTSHRTRQPGRRRAGSGQRCCR